MSNLNALGVVCQGTGVSARAFASSQAPRDMGVMPEAKETVGALHQEEAGRINADDTGLVRRAPSPRLWPDELAELGAWRALLRWGMGRSASWLHRGDA